MALNVFEGSDDILRDIALMPCLEKLTKKERDELYRQVYRFRTAAILEVEQRQIKLMESLKEQSKAYYKS